MKMSHRSKWRYILYTVGVIRTDFPHVKMLDLQGVKATGFMGFRELELVPWHKGEDQKRAPP